MDPSKRDSSADTDIGLLQERSRELRFEFISTELDLALTFCRIALSTDDQNKARREEAQALRAYRAAKHFLKEGMLNGAMDQTIREKMDGLERLLSDLRRT